MVPYSAGYVLAKGNGDGEVGIAGLGQTPFLCLLLLAFLITILTRGQFPRTE